MILRCNKCKLSKLSNDFYPSDFRWCKQCRSEYSKKKNNAIQIREDLSNGNRICNKCKTERKLEYFPKDKRCKLGRARTCSICVYKSRDTKERKANQKKLTKRWYQDNRELSLKRQTKRYEENREQLLAYGRQHSKNNPEIYKAANHRRRAAKRNNGNNDLTAKQIVELFDKQKNCEYCDAEGNLTIDHVIPISKGGQNTLTNVVLACMSCNNSKRAKIL